MATSENELFVRTFARGLRVIEVLGESIGSQNIAQVSEAAQLPRTVVRRLLLTLTELGFVETDEKYYWLTPKVLRLGMTYLYSLPFWRRSQLELEDLGTHIKQSCAISVLDQNDIVYIQRFHTKRILSMSPAIGSRLPAYVVSMGRVMLSGLTEEELDEYFQNLELKPLTSRTLVDVGKLKQKIVDVRNNGFAWVEGEYDDTIAGLAVPIRDREGQIIAALNVSLILGDFTEETARAEFLPVLKLTASRLRADS